MAAAHPSVRSARSRASSRLSRCPTPAARASVSPVSNASWSRPISTSLWFALSRAKGRSGAVREARTTWNLGGTCSISAPSASRQLLSTSRWTSSRTRTPGRRHRCSSEARRGTAAARMRVPGAASAVPMDGSTGSTRSIAAATYVRNTLGALSNSSIVNHATARRAWAAQSASSTVLPYPAGAMTETTGGAGSVMSRPVSRGRATVAGPGIGRLSFASTRRKRRPK